MVRSCEEEGRRVHAKKNGRRTGTRKRIEEENRNTGGKTPIIGIWCGAEGGRSNGQDNVEERNTKLFHRPQMMGKVREEE